MISHQDIESTANSINARLDYSRLNQAKPLDLYQLLDFLDIRLSIDYLSPDSSILGAAFFANSTVYTWPSNPYIKGMMPMITPFKKRTVSLDRQLFESENTTDRGKTNFTACHETGHVLFHSEEPVGACLLCKEDDIKLHSITDEYARQREIEANHFASALLMPESMIFKETKILMPDYRYGKVIPFNSKSYKQLVIPISKALHINTSPVTYRLQNLGLLTEQYIQNI